MTTKTWKVMNDLEEAFSEITAFGFMLEQLQEVVDSGDFKQIIDITAALNAFYPIYVSNFDGKFRIAWCHVVGTPKLDI